MGFIASRDRAIDGSDRIRVLGPFFERQARADGSTFAAIRPFYSFTGDSSNEHTLAEYLWPVATCKQHHEESYSRILTAYLHDFDRTNSLSKDRHMIFPVLFWGRNSSNEPYFAFFPLGGRIDDFLFRDRIDFALFPLYTHSTVNDLKSTDLLWPLLSRTTGGKASAFRFFPFYGESARQGEWSKQFVMWPLWSRADYFYEDDAGRSYILFPLFGHSRLTKQETWWIVPPFLKWARGPEYTAVNAPWPLFQYVSGKNEKKLYLWPLWGARETGKTEKSSFFLWPVGWTMASKSPSAETSKFYLVPLICSETVSRPAVAATNAVGAQTGETAAERYFKLWPLFSWQSNADAARFRTLELWPMRDPAPIERNLAPFWSLYTHSANNGRREDDFLWGLFHYDRSAAGDNALCVFPLFSWRKTEEDAGAREFNLLLGLFGYKREGLQRTWRLLYFINF